ncbi:MAG: hypothetical protein FWD15_02085 [Alphaproteobacteria bacterium]|nr:hypothetical protein [Alphaproteobacteria bacterium]
MFANKMPKTIARFLFDIGLRFNVAVIMGGALLATWAIFAMGHVGFDAEWFPGQTFDKFIQSMGAIADNGKYSAVDRNICPTCGALASLFDLVGVAATWAYGQVYDVIWLLLTFGFALWLLNETYERVLDEKKFDNSFFVDVVKKIIVISIIGAALGLSSEREMRRITTGLVNGIAAPIIGAGADMGATIMQSPLCKKLSYPKSDATKEDLIASDAKESILCMASTMNVIFFSGIVSGKKLAAMNLEISGRDIMGRLPGLILGLMISALFFLLYIWIAIEFISIIFTFGVLLAFVPLMIAGFAYEETKSFSMKGIENMIGVAWWFIIYSIFLQLIYQSLFAIGDRFYPGPADGFTYLFPDFFSSTGSNATFDAWQACSAGVEKISAIEECARARGIEVQTAGGWQAFMPMLGGAVLALMLMGMMKSYAKLVGRWSIDLGGVIKTSLQSGWKYVKSYSREAAGHLRHAFGEDTRVGKRGVLGSAIDKIFKRET